MCIRPIIYHQVDFAQRYVSVGLVQARSNYKVVRTSDMDQNSFCNGNHMYVKNFRIFHSAVKQK